MTEFHYPQTQNRDPVESLEDDERSRWTVNNSPLADYFYWLSEDLDVKAMLRERLTSENQTVGIDLAAGSDGVAIRDLLESAIIDRGLFTNLQDHRSSEVRDLPEIDHMAGDLTHDEMWQRITKWVAETAPDGVDLVLHRPAGAMQHLMTGFYRRKLHTVLGLIRPGGIFFTQVPSQLRYRSNDALQEICSELKHRAEVIVPRSQRRLPSTAIIIKNS